ncbi:MAG: Response regulator of zinc sigma-54-dependent two-component system [Myxococcaceae bacterium]|nr:Response regulator of zinc sigma-54-dependent two-component system [Myxococcaceae bacterium]
MTNSLVLMRDGVELTCRALGDEPIEIGSAATCDLVVEDLALPARAYLVQARGGTVWLFDLLHTHLEARVLPLGRPLALGNRHQLVRRFAAAPPARARLADSLTTQAIDPQQTRARSRWSVVVGRGGEARRVSLGERPLRVGKAAHNDLVLSDPTVSAEHCRFELTGNVPTVRDLDSTNGTYVHGVRVGRAQLSAGAQVRVGRTDLHLMARAQDGEPEAQAGTAQAGHSTLVAASSSMQEVVAEARRFALLPWPLLLLGPSGVGKEELAGLVHREGTRLRAPLVALNAGGLPRELVESELFGHERGAFTGAHAQRRGVFEQATGGTLFLDEIGELPLSLQSRLLRVLETWQIRRVGGEADVPVDVRLVCATHRDLPQMVHEGTFRQDLYYRLARLVLRVQPLSQRAEDIVPLAQHFMRGLSRELGGKSLSRAAEARLLLHDWPGNARELRNVLCAAAALSATPVLDADDVERAILRVSGPLAPVVLDGAAVERAVARYGGNLSAASRALSIPRSTLRDRLRQSSPSRAMSSSSRPK